MCIKRRQGQQGQALLEYIILIFISLVFVLGFVYQFNTAFKTYLNTYFVGEGSYLYCLIADGLLPGDTSEDGACSPPKFDIKNGKALDATTAAGGGGAAAAAKNAANASRSTGRASEANSSRSVPFSKADRHTFAGANAAGPGPGKGGEGTKKDSTGNDGFSSAGAGAAGSAATATKTASTSRYVAYGASEEDASDNRKSKPIPVVERDMKTGREIATEKARRKKLLEESEENFSISNILKYIIVFVILFSILFFFGTAMVAISRGNRKRQ